MKENLNKARVVKDNIGFFASTHTPAIHHTHSNNPGKVSSYPAHYAPPGTPQFVFFNSASNPSLSM